MRILATFAFSFAAAIFSAIYGGLDPFLLPLGGIFSGGALAAGLFLRKGGRARTRMLLILSGVSAGFCGRRGI